MDFAAHFEQGLSYDAFLSKYATPEQLRRWNDFFTSVELTAEQKALLASFTREMKVLVMAGAWCGDCVNQCPIFEHFCSHNQNIRIRYFDRDDNPELMQALQTCGGSRVPCVLFLSEDGHVCGRYGDRTLSKYRAVVSSMAGPSCSTGLATAQSLTNSVVQDWLNEFERIQWMLRTSSRLRQLHGD
jgi:hypothetical protein